MHVCDYETGRSSCCCRVGVGVLRLGLCCSLHRCCVLGCVPVHCWLTQAAQTGRSRQGTAQTWQQ